MATAIAELPRQLAPPALTLDYRQATTTVEKAVASMATSQESLDEISLIVGMIEQIYDKVNLLAINVQIEAARTKATNSGFAAVAAEMRVLANYVREAAGQVKILVAKSSSDVRTAAKLMIEAQVALNSVVKRVDATEVVMTGHLNRAVSAGGVGL